LTQYQSTLVGVSEIPTAMLGDFSCLAPMAPNGTTDFFLPESELLRKFLEWYADARMRTNANQFARFPGGIDRWLQQNSQVPRGWVEAAHKFFAYPGAREAFERLDVAGCNQVFLMLMLFAAEFSPPNDEELARHSMENPKYQKVARSLERLAEDLGRLSGDLAKKTQPLVRFDSSDLICLETYCKKTKQDPAFFKRMHQLLRPNVLRGFSAFLRTLVDVRTRTDQWSLKQPRFLIPLVWVHKTIGKPRYKDMAVIFNAMLHREGKISPSNRKIKPKALQKAISEINHSQMAKAINSLERDLKDLERRFPLAE
jgi:hypothetical protein